MSKAADAQWQQVRIHHSLLAKVFVLCSILWKIEVVIGNVNLARKISESLKVRSAVGTAFEDYIQPGGGQTTSDRPSSSTAYVDLEDRLFYNKDKRAINSSEASFPLLAMRNDSD